VILLKSGDKMGLADITKNPLLTKVDKLRELKEILIEENLFNKNEPFENRYALAVKNKKVREILEFENAQISDFTNLLEIKNDGKLFVVREDLTKGVDNHKKSVVGGLILRGVLNGDIPRTGIDTLIDGGNYNSAKALNYYTKNLGMKGMYVMSRLFPEHILKLLRSNHFQIIQAPKVYENALEREFYDFLWSQMKKQDFRSNKYCLWHAKYGGKASYPFGKEIASRLEDVPDYVVSCLGAGSTLEGLQIPIQDYFAEKNTNKKPKIIVGEHELSPLFSKYLSVDASYGSPKVVEEIIKDIEAESYFSTKELPHLVIGPHYNEINPLLSKASINRIDKIIQYSEHDWMAMQKYLDKKGISAGNSSAANINVATNLANQGNVVLTVIFEPFREFYKKQ
jgi:cysteine synthase